ncbi:amidophosphoribosyltransferase [Ascoidea rubescens DSM 1968]|uniref:PRTase-like protein n=1 Tax=Ascoidea rubescens DSM 1968 TaxID=1344418 RepID=A0A1D2VR83_9ASCO|nr:PRTase-like protein [Ascoidea rubescens DSM 1968]ODV64122.1 PRTase-like protein [Ascoidea rubescens DSM 1968]
MLAGYGLIAFRDSNGIKPLLIGERTSVNNGNFKDYMIASESVVLKAHGFKVFRDILPGEAVIIPKSCSKPIFKQIQNFTHHAPDIFEYVYFARPDSILDGISVYHTRLNMGKKLAQTLLEQFDNDLSKIDVVIPVPDTARDATLSCAEILGLPYREGFIKNRYVGRTFIMPNQAERVSSVRRKLNVMESEFKNKNVLLIDDSIVRGTTSKEIVQMAREAGAKKVYLASCSSPIRFNHIYGIDLANKKDLLASNRSIEEITAKIGADKVIYQKLNDLIDSCSSSTITDFEVGVFNGNYITGCENLYLSHLELFRSQPLITKANGFHNSCAIDLSHSIRSQVDVNLYNLCDQ